MSTELTTKQEDKPTWKRRARKWGIALAITLPWICKSLPPEYQSICDTIASICTAGLGG